MRAPKTASALVLTVTVLVSAACGSGGDSGPNHKANTDPGVAKLTDRAKSYWSALAEGDADAAYKFLSDRCLDLREDSPDHYEQRWINRLADTQLSSQQLIDNTDIGVRTINDQDSAVVDFTPKDDLWPGFQASKWVRSDTDNQWYLDSCKPPFASATADKESRRLEKDTERDVERGRTPAPATLPDGGN